MWEVPPATTKSPGSEAKQGRRGATRPGAWSIPRVQQQTQVSRASLPPGQQQAGEHGHSPVQGAAWGMEEPEAAADQHQDTVPTCSRLPSPLLPGAGLEGAPNGAPGPQASLQLLPPPPAGPGKQDVPP